MFKLSNYINGVLQAPTSGKYIDNFNPSKGEVYSLIPESDASDLKLAYTAAEAAFIEWRKTPNE